MSQDNDAYDVNILYVHRIFFDTQALAEAAEWWMARHYFALLEDSDLLLDTDTGIWELRIKTTQKLDATDIAMIEHKLHPCSRANNLDEV